MKDVPNSICCSLVALPAYESTIGIIDNILTMTAPFPKGFNMHPIHLYATISEPVTFGDLYIAQAIDGTQVIVKGNDKQGSFNYDKIIASTDPTLELPLIQNSWINSIYIPSQGNVQLIWFKTGDNELEPLTNENKETEVCWHKSDEHRSRFDSLDILRVLAASNSQRRCDVIISERPEYPNEINAPAPRMGEIIKAGKNDRLLIADEDYEVGVFRPYFMYLVSHRYINEGDFVLMVDNNRPIAGLVIVAEKDKLYLDHDRTVYRKDVMLIEATNDDIIGMNKISSSYKIGKQFIQDYVNSNGRLNQVNIKLADALSYYTRNGKEIGSFLSPATNENREVIIIEDEKSSWNKEEVSRIIKKAYQLACGNENQNVSKYTIDDIIRHAR